MIQENSIESKGLESGTRAGEVVLTEGAGREVAGPAVSSSSSLRMRKLDQGCVPDIRRRSSGFWTCPDASTCVYKDVLDVANLTGGVYNSKRKEMDARQTQKNVSFAMLFVVNSSCHSSAVLNSIAGSGKISSKDLPFVELSNECFAMLVSNLGCHI
ncbi:hypothetical protein WN51_06197 [Melipona quadrifasciata]|uniref:Uncharacterized protein n=1 Tax=Melipona quadrifasciata TaxID=166423 RepID=A0A0M8ZTD2_9HYME|nr:hypothetical protein WN51_06197 [Melipona quadrifasciata]